MNIDLKFLESIFNLYDFRISRISLSCILKRIRLKKQNGVLKSENKKLIEETERRKKDFQLEISKRR